MIKIKLYIILVIITVCTSCSNAPDVSSMQPIEQDVQIFPDYKGVTVPSNIAPLNFKLLNVHEKSILVLSSKTYSFVTKGKDEKFNISPSKWKELLSDAQGNLVTATICVNKNDKWMAYPKFTISVAPDDIDGYLAYRLIAPGYELWNKMGIYQRDLTGFSETPIIENTSTGNNCVNCHSFCMQNPEKMLLHMRETFPGTILIDGNKTEKLNTKTPQTISSLVYPSWHPSGKYVAFSVNNTKQAFHKNDRNRIEVYDEKSDVVVYDIEKHEIVTTKNIFSSDAFETFPTFSPDGKTLYFCSAKAKEMPLSYKDLKYNICSIAFDPDKRSFGNRVDTLYNSDKVGKSASFPRVSPDGKYLMYTLSGYGNFSIWHKDADLYMADLSTGMSRPVQEANSDDVESYHSWSSNSRWFVFSSRRMDGLYTHPYIAYIDKNGKVAKPFMLPQADADFYYKSMSSFNIPEFVKGKVKTSPRRIALTAKDSEGINVKFAE